jgi:hypothetical protein
MPTKRKPEPGDPNFQWGVDDPNTVDRLLEEARGSLGRADQLSAETDAPRLAMLPASLASLRQPMDTRGPVRKFTEPLADVGGKAMLAAIPAGINPAIGGALLAGGGLATLPDYFRKLIAPEGDETRPGIMETGMAGLAALPATGALHGLRSLTGLGKGAEALANPAADLLEARWARALGNEGPQAVGRALAFEGPQVAGRGSSAIEKLLASPSFENLPRGAVSKAKPASIAALKIAGPQQGPMTFADAVRAEAKRVKSPFEQMQQEGAFQGDRTTGQFKEGSGGLSDVAAGRVSRNDMPWEPIDLSSEQPLSLMERLAARSQERFGKRYRRE